MSSAAEAPAKKPAEAKSAGPAYNMDDIVNVCKRRGFVFQSSEIYNGFNGFYDYGPLGGTCMYCVWAYMDLNVPGWDAHALPPRSAYCRPHVVGTCRVTTDRSSLHTHTLLNLQWS